MENKFSNNLLREVLRGKLSPNDPRFIEWLEVSKENEQEFELEIIRLAQEIKIGNHLNVKESLDKIKINISKYNKKHELIRFCGYVAILFIFVGIGISYLIVNQSDKHIPARIVSQVTTENRAATLILPEGECISLEKSDTLLQEAGKANIILPGGKKIVYEAENDSLYNILTTPSLCDFTFTLPDGTVVWLNARSSLRFPVAFIGDERVVYAEGEIYLEVKEDLKHPFFVVLDNMKIEVLGTSFNVNAYPEEDFVEVTLVRGHIVVCTNKLSYDLWPNKQLSLNKIDDEVSIRMVNVSDYTGWKSGKYIFKEKPLWKVARVLQRWYDLEIVFENKRCEQAIYTGVINKEEKIDVFIERLSKTSQLECRIEGNRVFIK